MKLLIASTNRGKLSELRVLLADLPMTVLSLDDTAPFAMAEEDGATFAENALKKARGAAAITGFWTLADDSGLCVDALEGRPGVRSARFAGEHATDAQNLEKLLYELRDVPHAQRRAHFICALALCASDGREWLLEGRCDGAIADAARGTHGFGYDPIFIPEGEESTFSELGAAAKARLSHRSRALQQLREVLIAILGRET